MTWWLSPSRDEMRSAGTFPSALSLVALVVSLTLTPDPAGLHAATGGPPTKIGPELQSLYEAYRAAQKAGAPFVSADPLIPVVR